MNAELDSSVRQPAPMIIFLKTACLHRSWQYMLKHLGLPTEQLHWFGGDWEPYRRPHANRLVFEKCESFIVLLIVGHILGRWSFSVSAETRVNSPTANLFSLWDSQFRWEPEVPSDKPLIRLSPRPGHWSKTALTDLVLLMTSTSLETISPNFPCFYKTVTMSLMFKSFQRKLSSNKDIRTSRKFLLRLVSSSSSRVTLVSSKKASCWERIPTNKKGRISNHKTKIECRKEDAAVPQRPFVHVCLSVRQRREGENNSPPPRQALMILHSVHWLCFAEYTVHTTTPHAL